MPVTYSIGVGGPAVIKTNRTEASMPDYGFAMSTIRTWPEKLLGQKITMIRTPRVPTPKLTINTNRTPLESMPIGGTTAVRPTTIPQVIPRATRYTGP